MGVDASGRHWDDGSLEDTDKRWAWSDYPNRDEIPSKLLPKADVKAQLERLTKMLSGSMAPDLKKWVAQRVAILKQLDA